MVELNNITVVKGGKTLFSNFNLEIHKGEHWVIQGENGSGKTTLLQLIAGALTPTSGKINHTFIKGKDWDARYQQRQRRIHFIPTHWIQSFLSGYENLFYQQRYYSIEDTDLPKVADVFDGDVEALKSHTFPNNFDIHQLLGVPITRLSNGQLKKVIILRQLVRNVPDLLLMDYPFDGLDAYSRADLNNFLDDITTRFGIQVIITDHGHALPTVINRRLVLDNFRIREGEASPSMTGEVPKTPEVVTNTGSPVVEMRDVTIAYSGKEIISKLNWRVNKGERWALTGKNGSGKTTLFSLIFADHPRAYSEKVYLFGKRRGSGESIWDIKNRINYLGPEQIHFLDYRTKNFSGREYILMQPHMIAARLETLIERFNAKSYIDRPLRTLSSGQLQMVLLMNAFLDQKELLLLDEPFQFLDPLNHGIITDYLNDYLDQNITLILITHDEKDVARWTQFRKVLGH